MREIILQSAIRTYAAFIQNTVRPMLERLAEVFELARQVGMPITQESIEHLVAVVSRKHLHSVIVSAVEHVTIAVLICLTCYLVLR